MTLLSTYIPPRPFFLRTHFPSPVTTTHPPTTQPHTLPLTPHQPPTHTLRAASSTPATRRRSGPTTRPGAPQSGGTSMASRFVCVVSVCERGRKHRTTPTACSAAVGACLAIRSCPVVGARGQRVGPTLKDPNHIHTHTHPINAAGGEPASGDVHLQGLHRRHPGAGVPFAIVDEILSTSERKLKSVT